MNRNRNLEQQLDGMVMLRLQSTHTENALQLLSAHNIPLYQVKRTEQYLYVTIRLDDFTAVQHLLRERRWRFHICEKYGLPFVISRFKRRKGLWTGMLFCFAIGYLLLSFLWSYEVSGNERYSDAHMIALVQEYGLWPGSRLKGINYNAIEHAIIIDHPDITWIQLQPKGTTLYISVKERLAGSGDIETSGSIVAKADGQITELLVYHGTALAERGDWVKKGQVLVGGWEYPERVRNNMGEFVDAGKPYAVRAKSVVCGQQERRAIGTCALEEQWLQLTGKSETQKALVWQEYSLIAVGPKQSPYEYSKDTVEIKAIFQWGAWQCPLKIKTVTYEEQALLHRSYSAEEAYQTAVERARKQLQQQLPQTSTFIRESSGMYRSTKSGVIQAEVVWIVDEPIGQIQQVPLPAAAVEKEE